MGRTASRSRGHCSCVIDQLSDEHGGVRGAERFKVARARSMLRVARRGRRSVGLVKTVMLVSQSNVNKLKCRFRCYVVFGNAYQSSCSHGSCFPVLTCRQYGGMPITKVF